MLVSKAYPLLAESPTSTCLTNTPTEDWDLDMEERFDGFPDIYENYKLFIHASTLTNCISLKEQLLPSTRNRKIFIDMSCDIFGDEHFFDVRFWEWEHYENKCNIRINKNNK